MPQATSKGKTSCDMPDLTLIVPCHNEESNIPVFFESASVCLNKAGISWELVFINDGSTDSTMQQLKALVGKHPTDRLQVIGFSRNFGKESALFAGLQAAKGSYIGLIDADMQQDPALAVKMFEYLKSHGEFDVVAAYQEQRREGVFLRWCKNVFYKTFNATSDQISLPANMSDFRVFKRDVRDALLSMPEYFRFSKGLFAWVGFNTHSMPYTPNERNAGRTSWSFKSLFKYATGGMLAFTTWPLKVAKYIGFVASVAALVYLLYVLIVDYLVMGIGVPGYPTLVCLVLLLGGMQLLVLGIIGDYLARDYLEGKHRPLYIVRERLSTDVDNESRQ